MLAGDDKVSELDDETEEVDSKGGKQSSYVSTGAYERRAERSDDFSSGAKAATTSSAKTATRA